MDFDLEFVTLEAGDGKMVEGALYTPKTRFARYKTGFLLIHGAYGNFYTGIPRLCSERMAKRGFFCLAINTRYHDYLDMDMILEEEVDDIRAGARFLQEAGCSRIVLLGHSLGVIRVVYYVAETKDPAVKGLILLAGVANLSEWSKQAWGEKTMRKLMDQADDKLVKDPCYLIRIPERARRKWEWYHPQMPEIVTFQIKTARSFLNLRHPNTNADLNKHIGKIKVPILIIQGTKDTVVPSKTAETIRELSSSSDLIYIAGANHYFVGYEDKLVSTIANWLEKSKLLKTVVSAREL